MSEKITQEERSKIFLSMYMHLLDLESGKTPQYISPLEELLMKALDDKDFRIVLISNPERAVKLANIKANEEEMSRLNLFLAQHTLSDMPDSKGLKEKFDMTFSENELMELNEIREEEPPETERALPYFGKAWGWISDKMGGNDRVDRTSNSVAGVRG